MDASSGAYPLHALNEFLFGDPPEVELHAARSYCGSHLLRVCRREDEDGMLRRFLERLEEGVLCRGTEHVDLVDDVHLVPSDCRRVLHHLDDGPEVVHAVVGGRVELYYIDEPALAYRLAVCAFSAREVHARIAGFAFRAVDSLCEYPRGAGLARAVSSGK